MRVCVHNMFRYYTRYGLLLTYVGSSLFNPPSLVSTVLYVAVMGVHQINPRHRSARPTTGTLNDIPHWLR